MRSCYAGWVAATGVGGGGWVGSGQGGQGLGGGPGGVAGADGGVAGAGGGVAGAGGGVGPRGGWVRAPAAGEWGRGWRWSGTGGQVEITRDARRRPAGGRGHRPRGRRAAVWAPPLHGGGPE